ncbi:MAG TPA: hypothetical protein VMS93_11610 [Candidatus Saccharimonadales bacterium]|nr:hypothetical protein [Candidatus Saccharimonadales bacterium]
MTRVQSERRAAIDVGTNSVRLLVADVHPDGRVCALVQRGTITRLGEGLDATGRISPAAAARTLKAIQAALAEARATGARQVVLAATSALRSAENGPELSREIGEQTGVAVRILSGDEEARLVFQAVQNGCEDNNKVIVMDIGGGSIEFAFGNGSTFLEARSIDLGCVILYERASAAGGIESESGYVASRAWILDALQANIPSFRDEFSGVLIRGVGGTFTAFAMLHNGNPRYDPSEVDGTVLDRQEQAQISRRLREMPLDQRRHWVGEGRADLVLAGAAILDEAVQFFGAPRVQVSTHGLRYALVHEAAPRPTGS